MATRGTSVATATAASADGAGRTDDERDQAARRGRPRSAEADQAIVAATLDLLEERGYTGLTMAGVAERAGVSTATLYRRCSSKEELVVGALAELVPARPAMDTGTLEGDLRETLRRICDTTSRDRGGLLLALAGEVVRHPALAEPVHQRLTAPMADNLRTMFDRAVERGEIDPPADLDVAIAVAVGPLHYWLLSGQQVKRNTIDLMIPPILAALGGS